MNGRCRSSGTSPPRSRSSATEPAQKRSLAVGGLALPDGQRRAPVALARERPVDVALQPLAEASVLDVVGPPADLSRSPPASGRGRRWCGCTSSTSRSRGAGCRSASSAGRRARRPPPAATGRIRRSASMMSGIGVLDEAAREVGDPVVEGAVRAHRVLERDPVLLAEPEVVLAEGDRGVDDPGAVRGRDEVADQHGVPARSVVGDVGEGRLVADARERRAREVAEDLDVLAEHPLDQVAREHETSPSLRGADVLDLLADRERRVGDQRPRRRRPGQQLVAGLDRRLGDRVVRRHLDHRHPHVDRRVLDVAVALRDLVRGQRGAVARAVGDDLVAPGRGGPRPRSGAATTRPTRCSRCRA